MVIATTINAFHVLGALTAIWAVVLFLLGVMSHEFPAKAGVERAVIAVSALLVVSTITAAIVTSGEEKPKGEEAAAATQKSGKEGSGAPSQGGTAAPQTGAESGQASGGAKSQKPPAQAVAQTLTLSADPSGALKFDKTALSAKAGNVKLVLNNPAPVPHNISIEGGGVSKQGPTVQKGGASQVSVALKAGTYTYYCAVPGHRQAGMEGQLTVK